MNKIDQLLKEHRKLYTLFESEYQKNKELVKEYHIALKF